MNVVLNSKEHTANIPLSTEREKHHQLSPEVTFTQQCEIMHPVYNKVLVNGGQ